MKEEKDKKSHENVILRQKEFHEKLKKAFPILWRTPEIGQEVSGCPTTREGWEGIIWECSEIISLEIESIKQMFPVCHMPRIDEVKEKFGELRIYTGTIPDPIYDNVCKAIYDAEDKSKKTCEFCGDLGKIRSTFPETDAGFGWINVLCEPCWYEESEYRVKNGFKVTKHVRRWYYDRMKNKKLMKKINSKEK